MELSVAKGRSESIAETSKIRLTLVPLELVHGTKDVLAHPDGPWSGSRFGSAHVVGAGRHHTNLRLQLVVRVSHWLVLTPGAANDRVNGG